jgi:hypothetical protein
MRPFVRFFNAALSQRRIPDSNTRLLFLFIKHHLCLLSLVLVLLGVPAAVIALQTGLGASLNLATQLPVSLEVRAKEQGLRLQGFPDQHF